MSNASNIIINYYNVNSSNNHRYEAVNEFGITVFTLSIYTKLETAVLSANPQGVEANLPLPLRVEYLSQETAEGFLDCMVRAGARLQMNNLRKFA